MEEELSKLLEKINTIKNGSGDEIFLLSSDEFFLYYDVFISKNITSRVAKYNLQYIQELREFILKILKLDKVLDKNIINFISQRGTSYIAIIDKNDFNFNSFIYFIQNGSASLRAEFILEEKAIKQLKEKLFFINFDDLRIINNPK